MKDTGMSFYDQLKAARFHGSGQKKPKKLYCYVGTDEKTYVGTDGKVYAAKKGA